MFTIPRLSILAGRQSFFTFLLALVIVSFDSNSQHVIGKVVDAKTGEPLAFANVFLNNNTIGAVSDSDGSFVLSSVPVGMHELVISFVGYDVRKIVINVRRADLFLGQVLLVPSLTELNSVVIRGTRDKDWEKQVRKFNSVFLGKDEFAKSCRILNPWVLEFSTENNEKKFTAKAGQPIEILNAALGYKIYYYLQDFWSRGKSYNFSGHVRFEELLPETVDQEVDWRKNRAIAFQESYNFLFYSILRRELNKNGFSISRAESGPSKYADLLNWVPIDTASVFFGDQNTGEQVIELGRLVNISNSHTRERSVIEIKGERVVLNENGFVLNPTDLIVSGKYYEHRLGHLLPISYSLKTEADHVYRGAPRGLFERIHVQTDKGYYYPGETVWFKGYVHTNADLRDSLSRTAYIELISPSSSIELSKTLAIEGGIFYGELDLPDTLMPGNYFLRVYTNSNRNFGEKNLFAGQLPILRFDEEPVELAVINEEEVYDSSLLITFSKPAYKVREKIQMSLKTSDEERQPLSGNVSISVTDVFRVAPITRFPAIMKLLTPFHPPVPAGDKVYPLELGLHFRGQFLNDRDQPEQVKLNIIRADSMNALQAITDANGYFEIDGLYFYDSAVFAVQPERNSQESSGTVTIVGRDIPAIIIPTAIPVMTRPSTQQLRWKEDFTLDQDTRLLEEVVVTGRKVQRDIQFLQGPNSVQIIKGKDINRTNVLFTLKSALGVDVDLMSGMVRSTRGGIRTGAQLSQKDPGGSPYSLSIDGVLVPEQGSIGLRLSSLDPAEIDFMIVGRNYISVFMKRPEEVVATPNFQRLVLKGYAAPRPFRSPNYELPGMDASRPDHRSTLYWDPSVTTSSDTGTVNLTFFAADLPGRYRIVVEGMLEDGRPVRSVRFVEIEDD